MTTRNWKNWAILLALPFALAVTACEQSGGDAGIFAPQETVLRDAKVVHGAGGRESATAVIGQDGGRINLSSGHQLIIPGGAVNAPTTFSFSYRGDGYVAVDLSATRTDANGNTVNVGAAGFAVPVQLILSYQSAYEVSDPSALSIGWLVDGTYEGTVKLLASTVNIGAAKISAELTHFSAYAVIQ